jgi:regulatory factor X 1/2/3
MYKLYLHHCNDKLKPLTPPSLGKIISRVFSQLKTRRIGKRGNSKYHYYGIRLIPGSPASKLAEKENLVDCQQKSQRGCKFWSRSGVSGTGILKTGNKYEQNASSSVGLCHCNSLQQDPHPHLYPGNLPETIPDFPGVEFPLDLPEDCTLGDLDTFCRIYRERCAAFVDSVANSKFLTVESLWRAFW